MATHIEIGLTMFMQRKLTIDVDSDVYEALHTVIGRDGISRFMNDLVRPIILPDDLAAGYADMAADEERERDALIWSEALIGDAGGERAH